MSLDKDRFRPDSGRPRPEYKPKDIHCKGCGAGLTVKSEHAEMVVCSHCGSHLDCSSTEQKVLAKGSQKSPSFYLQIGDSFRYKAARFEVLARLAYIEDGDKSEMTREYLLYNPRRGAIWLGEYNGSFSLTRTTHVIPKSDPFSLERAGVLKTHDEQQWIMDGKGVYELYYVDGALPWIATVGDKISYAEFNAKSGSGKIYEVQQTGSEIEYATGKSMLPESVRRAANKSQLIGQKRSKHLPEDVARVRKWYLNLIIIALVAALFNGALGIYCSKRGKVVLSQGFPAELLTEGIVSDAFSVSGNGTVTRITASSPLNNAWMSIEVAILKDSDNLAVHTYSTSLEYYHGSDGGESWSEGNKKKSLLIKIPQKGQYRLFLQAISAKGNSASSQRAMHSLDIRIKDNALSGASFTAAAVVCTILFVISILLYYNWKKRDE